MILDKEVYRIRANRNRLEFGVEEQCQEGEKCAGCPEMLWRRRSRTVIRGYGAAGVGKGEWEWEFG